MFKKTIVLALILGAVWWIYNRYGYLLQSYSNLPSRGQITDTTPTSLPEMATDPDLSFLKLPDGFAMTYFAENVPGARSLAVSDKGVVFVGTRSQGVVYALEDTGTDGRANNRYIVAKGLNSPNAIVYHQGDLYVAEIGRIIVFRDIDNTYKDAPQFEVVYDQLPKEEHHGWRYMKIGPDNKLYIGIGAPCNVCERPDPYASIARLNTDGTEFQVIARGIRNTVGFDWQPITNTLWFTENGRDQMGDNIPGDELNVLNQPGSHFGFPFCHQGDTLDPQFGKEKSCEDYTAPAAVLGPHVAALGVHFYTGPQFPEEYKAKAIIAEHGSWNRSTPIGYRLMTVDVDGNTANNYREFVTGWLDQGGNAKGRPVDLLEMADGSLLISDDLAGAVYRLSYSNN